jgi:hypothetical protein
MGFFSFKTNKGVSVANIYTANPTYIYVTDNQGNQIEGYYNGYGSVITNLKKWKEAIELDKKFLRDARDKGIKVHYTDVDANQRKYEVDIHQIIAQMNGKETRDDGVGLYFERLREGNNDILLPLISESPSDKWNNDVLEDCPNQGFFGMGALPNDVLYGV